MIFSSLSLSVYQQDSVPLYIYFTYSYIYKWLNCNDWKFLLGTKQGQNGTEKQRNGTEKVANGTEMRRNGTTFEAEVRSHCKPVEIFWFTIGVGIFTAADIRNYLTPIPFLLDIV